MDRKTADGKLIILSLHNTGDSPELATVTIE